MASGWLNSSRLFCRDFGWLILLTMAVSAFISTYVLFGKELTGRAQLLASYTPPLAIALWIVWDARRRKCTPCFDFGFLVYVAFLLAVPGYLVWTRGWRGFFVFLFFIGLLLTPWLCAVMIWEAIYAG